MKANSKSAHQGQIRIGAIARGLFQIRKGKKGLKFATPAKVRTVVNRLINQAQAA